MNIIDCPKEPDLGIWAANLGHVKYQPDFALKLSHLGWNILRCIVNFLLVSLSYPTTIGWLPKCKQMHQLWTYLFKWNTSLNVCSIVTFSCVCLEGKGIKRHSSVPSTKPMYRVRSTPPSGTNVIPVMSRPISRPANGNDASNCTPGAPWHPVGLVNL